MPEYRRADVPGGAFFFTIVTYRRRPVLCSTAAVALLRRAIAADQRRRPFTIDAAGVLPDHLHMLWRLPPGDADFSTCWRKIKEAFTRGWRAANGFEPRVSQAQSTKGLRGVWQLRFWEHAIRDEDDWRRLADYIHYNPVKHGLTTCPHAWPWSSFAHWVQRGVYDPRWCCACDGTEPQIPRTVLTAAATGE